VNQALAHRLLRVARQLLADFYEPDPAATQEGEWIRDPEGSAVGWRQDHKQLLRDAMYSWMGWPDSMRRGMRAAIQGAPQPSSGSGKQERAQAEALLWELAHKARRNLVALYRGSHRDPRGWESWSEDRSVAELWARKSHDGAVYELPPRAAEGLRIQDYRPDMLGESQWIIEGDHVVAHKLTDWLPVAEDFEAEERALQEQEEPEDEEVEW